MKYSLTCKALLLFGLLVSLLLVPLGAVEVGENVNLRGFGTLNAVMNTSDETARRSLPNGSSAELEPNQVYWKSSWAGLQLDSSLGDAFDLMVQGIYINKRDSDVYEGRLEWAMLGYHFGDDYTLRLGKMKIASMDGAQNRYIGYSYLWVYPQVSFNGINGFENFYGADLSKRGYAGHFDYEWQINGGKLQNHTNQFDEGNYLYSASLKLSYEAWMARLGAGRLNFDHYGKEGNLIGKDEILDFVSLELQWHQEAFEVDAGYSLHHSEAIPDTNRQYLSAAYRTDTLSPYLLYTRQQTMDIPAQQAPAVANPGGTPPAATPPELPKKRDRLEQHYIMGMRYDVYDGVALKAEYDQMHYEMSEEGETTSHLINVSVDVVF